MLKLSAFYLDKQKNYFWKNISKYAKIRLIQKMALAILIFSEGFDSKYYIDVGWNQTFDYTDLGFRYGSLSLSDIFRSFSALNSFPLIFLLNSLLLFGFGCSCPSECPSESILRLILLTIFYLFFRTIGKLYIAYHKQKEQLLMRD